MKAMIFAAGLGTRLRPLTDTMPKALVPVGGEPLLSIVAHRLIAAGADSLVVNAHHFAAMIEDYVRQENGFGVHTDVSLEADRLLDTGGGIRHAERFLRGNGHFLVHNVDILSNLSIRDFVSHARPDALATLVVSKRETSRRLLFDDWMRLVGWTDIRTGEVRSPFPDLDPDKCQQRAFAGIHYMSDGIFDVMDALGEPEAFPVIGFYLAAAADYPIYGYEPQDLRILDVGKPESLAAAEEFLISSVQSRD